MLSFFTAASAQTRGKVDVVKDPRVDTLIAKRAELNKLIGMADVEGFRVQIFTGTNRRMLTMPRLNSSRIFPIFAVTLFTATPILRFARVISGRGWRQRNFRIS